jgi:uncharacterized protein YprB with RNaseH-like and TPR domain
MRLRDRLAQLEAPALADTHALHDAFADATESRGRSQRIAHLRSLIGEVVARDRGRSRAAAISPRAPGLLPAGAQRDTPAGPLHLIERWLEPHHQHGRIRVGDALQVDPSLLARLALDPMLERVDLARMLIIDTETTGLAGGTGTVPFLIGLGLFEDGALKLEQLFLSNLGGEAPLLGYLAQRIAQASCLVSYNGKAFDWPLLRARFVINRVALPEAPPHLDLLHCTRRVLKPRMQSVRLTEVEQTLLGFHRQDDIDGAEIPGLYLRYLRGEDPRTLLPVLTHNEHDLVALAAILWRLCAHFAQVEPADDPRDHLAYARVALRAQDLERAHVFAVAAAAGSDTAELTHGALLLSAAVERRRGDPHAAADAWQAALAAARDETAIAQAHLALSRLYERQLKDLRRAHHHARFTLPAEAAEMHGRRLGRLRRRLERLSD